MQYIYIYTSYVYHITYIYIYAYHMHIIYLLLVCLRSGIFLCRFKVNPNDADRLLGSLAFAGNSDKRWHSHEGLAG